MQSNNTAICGDRKGAAAIVRLKFKTSCIRYQRQLARNVSLALRAIFFTAELPGHEINITNHAGVLHLSMTPALCYFLRQIWQTKIGTVAFN